MWDFLQWVAAIGLSLLVIVIVLALCVAIFFAVVTGVIASFRESREKAYDEDAFYVRSEGKWHKVKSPSATSYTLEGSESPVRPKREKEMGIFIKSPPKGPSGGSDAFKGSDRPHLDIR